MKNTLLNLTARAAEKVAGTQQGENAGFWPGGSFLWSYEPKKPASLTTPDVDGGPDRPLAE